MIAEAYFLDEPAKPLVLRDHPLEGPGPDEAVVMVEACGLCHTDLSYASGSVRPRHPLPLVLGHEVVGHVVEAGERFAHLQDKPVLVPAVLPCGDCDYCRAGRGNACPAQKMPGNDIHGGFSTHLVVPAGPLVPLDGVPPSVRRDELSVVSDAVSTAYQAVVRAGVRKGDAVIVVGAGGVGGFLLQIAKALGAETMALDVSEERLESARRFGAEEGLNVADRDPREVKKAALGIARDWGVLPIRHKIFETSGTPQGQSLAYSLLGPAATLLQVGYTFEKVTVRLSNLMAFDATIHGSWGAPPEVYPECLQLIYDGKVVIGPFVEHASMSELTKLLDDMANHRLTKRMVLHPAGHSGNGSIH